MADHAFPHKGIHSLIEGYQAFHSTYFHQNNTYDDLIHEGQKPHTIIIACCDSRVDPAIVLRCHPGELFVVRNVANLVPSFTQDAHHHSTSAALEFAVTILNVRNIIVFGHSHCGGIRSLFENFHGDGDSDFIDTWMDIAQPAKRKTLDLYPQASLEEQLHRCEKKSLLISLENLNTFPWIHERVLKKELDLHAWYFSLQTGIIETYDINKEAFRPL